MKETIRSIINRNSYTNLTARLLKYREKSLHSRGIARFFYIRQYTRLQQKFCADIPLEAEIGHGLVLPHGANGIFISRGAKIGEKCVIFQQVTIGSNTLPDSKGFGSPRILNNVYIGAGAKIIGNCVIGNNCRIGANTIVTKNVPDNSTVVMSNARVIQKRNNKNTFQSLPFNSPE